MQLLLESRQLAPSATLRPSASTTHSEEEGTGMGSTFQLHPSSQELTLKVHSRGLPPPHSISIVMVLISSTSIQVSY